MLAVSDLNFILALGTIAIQIATVGLIALFVLRNQEGFADQISIVSRWGIWGAFVASFVGAAMTLFYSDVLGFEPCPLCWWQRIFLYPQVVILGMAIYKSDVYRRAAIDFSIVLSLIGLGFALYHHMLQILPSGSLPCPATGVSCAQRTIFEFGFVTFPMMAVALFMLTIVLMLITRQEKIHPLSRCHLDNMF